MHHLAGQPIHISTRKKRIALYSPGMVGLGHMRRNLLVAQTLARPPIEATILMVAEARQASALAMPPGMDCLTLPAMRKELDGGCRPRYLEIPVRELTALRAHVIRAALAEFSPDVLIVEHLPRGAAAELEPALEWLRARRRPRCILGLRDVLEDPGTVRREWEQAGTSDAIRDYYDAVWVYGDPAVYDLVAEYRLPFDVASKVRFTGYLDQRRRLDFVDTRGPEPLAPLDLPAGRLALCLVGGGQDGDRLAEAFARADLPPGTNGVILTGPFMSSDSQRILRRRAAGHPRLRVLDFVAEPALLLRRADRVVAMGGYNTVGDVLSFEKPALIVPRSRPRPEQAIRAGRLRDLGLIDVLDPDEVSPAALTEWLARDLGPPPRARDRIDLDGLARLPALLAEVIAKPSSTVRDRFPATEASGAAR
jgi:predicted glycosyltransferase